MNPKGRLHAYIKRLNRKSLMKDIQNQYIHQDVPYFSQWESPRLIKQILNRSIDTKDDPNWEQSGAKSKKEYEDWSWIGCGMACTKMLIAHKTGETIPLVELGKKCAEYGGYTYPTEKSGGLRYAPYSKFMKSEFTIDAKIVTPLIIEEIIAALNAKNYIIASVSPAIREPSSTPKSKGGHLVLIVGYNLAEKTLYLHNPSGTSSASQAYARVSFDDFKKFFSGRGIILEG